MSDEEKKNFDLKPFLVFFRRFFIGLAASIAAIGLPLYYIHRSSAGIFLSVFPLIAFVYFAWRSQKFYHLPGGTNKTAMWVVSVIFIGVLVLLAMGYKESHIVVTDQKISIEGMYGEDIPMTEIEHISSENTLPEIDLKSNGYAMGAVRKGYFVTDKNETVKLILNQEAGPFLLIVKKNGEKVYFNSADSTYIYKLKLFKK
jgi:hypothetical protein